MLENQNSNSLANINDYEEECLDGDLVDLPTFRNKVPLCPSLGYINVKSHRGCKVDEIRGMRRLSPTSMDKIVCKISDETVFYSICYFISVFIINHLMSRSIVDSKDSKCININQNDKFDKNVT